MAGSDEESGGEQADASLADVYEKVKAKPCSIDKINISPADLQTRILLILREFQNAKKAQTFDDVAKHTTQAVQNLEELGVFRGADARLMPGDPVQNFPCLRWGKPAIQTHIPDSFDKKKYIHQQKKFLVL
jgi:hypothetical protein